MSANLAPPSLVDALRALAGVTWMRLRRGKALWIGLAIAVLPIEDVEALASSVEAKHQVIGNSCGPVRATKRIGCVRIVRTTSSAST